MKTEDLEIYNLSMDLSDKIWNLVTEWDYFAKDTMSKQWVRSSDSIDANISEGFGRYTSKDSRNFYIFADGSLQESKIWLKKAIRRNLISEQQFKDLIKEIEIAEIKLTRFIKKHTELSQNK